MEKYDLHSHSTASDGSLTPGQLVTRAHEKGVTALALTDHDTTNGLEEARRTAQNLGLRLIPGIELSASWQKHCLHIVGLGIDPTNPVLQAGIEKQQQLRSQRALKISEKLEKKRIFGAFEAVAQKAGSGMITRLHYADFLVENQHVESQQQAFDKYLGQGKSAFVSTTWASLEETIHWITESGGIAVLAHPLRYKLTTSKLKKALSAFKQAGGKGIEVVTGRSSPDDIHRSLHFARLFELSASQGSDFHNPANEWVELGRLADMPTGIQPVWEMENIQGLTIYP